jgi:AraC-like DNA-binding protein
MMRGFGEQESDRNQRGRDETQVLPADRLEHCTAKHAGAGESDVCRGIVERNLQRSFPTIAVEEDQIFIVGGPIWTSAGMTATIDMALAMIEKDHGQDVSRAVARKLVVHHRRAGGQSQFSTLLDLEPKSDRIQKAIDYANANLRNALTVEELADVAGLSPRQFSRAFSAETAQSPAKAVEHLRVEAARLLLEKGRDRGRSRLLGSGANEAGVPADDWATASGGPALRQGNPWADRTRSRMTRTGLRAISFGEATPEGQCTQRQMVANQLIY